MACRTFLFMDVDGVLIRGYSADPALRRPWDKDIQNELDINPDDLSEFFFKKRFRAVLEGTAKLLPALEESLPELKYSGSAIDIVNYWFKGDACVDGTILDAICTIRRNKDWPLYIATNQEEMRASYLWNIVGFKDFFLDIFYSAKLGCMKDSAAFFDKINHDLGINPTLDNILFFDDHKEYVASANSVGWKAFLYREPSDFLEHPEIKDALT